MKDDQRDQNAGKTIWQPDLFTSSSFQQKMWNLNMGQLMSAAACRRRAICVKTNCFLPQHSAGQTSAGECIDMLDYGEAIRTQYVLAQAAPDPISTTLHMITSISVPTGTNTSWIRVNWWVQQPAEGGWYVLIPTVSCRNTLHDKFCQPANRNEHNISMLEIPQGDHVKPANVSFSKTLARDLQKWISAEMGRVGETSSCKILMRHPSLAESFTEGSTDLY